MKTKSNSKPISVNDFGFGSRPTGVRLLNRDGKYNIEKSGLTFNQSFDFFHTLISISWPKFFGFVFFIYFIENLIFASIYMLIGVENLDGMTGVTFGEKFAEAFFFSSQTITTLGYGRISPMGFNASVVAAFESLLGLLGFALITGLLYGRFSRPKSKVMFSEHALIAPYKEITSFEFRIVNLRNSQLIEVEAQVIMSWNENNLRRFEILNLEREKITILFSNWTIVHPITVESPLFGLNKDEVESLDPEFSIMIKGFDETFSQTVYSRTSYKFEELQWAKKFKQILLYTDDNRAVMALDMFNDTYEAALPENLIEEEIESSSN